MENCHFFDSWGAMHVTCAALDPGAQAFGPTGASRPVEPQTAGVFPAPGETAWAAARREGLLVDRDEEDPDSWATLRDE